MTQKRAILKNILYDWLINYIPKSMKRVWDFIKEKNHESF